MYKAAFGRTPKAALENAEFGVWTDAKFDILRKPKFSSGRMPKSVSGDDDFGIWPNAALAIRECQIIRPGDADCAILRCELFSSARCQIWHSRAANLASRQMKFSASQMPRSDSAYNFWMPHQNAKF
jgi:hypothetical protein